MMIITSKLKRWWRWLISLSLLSTNIVNALSSGSIYSDIVSSSEKIFSAGVLSKSGFLLFTEPHLYGYINANTKSVLSTQHIDLGDTTAGGGNNATTITHWFRMQDRWPKLYENIMKQSKLDQCSLVTVQGSNANFLYFISAEQDYHLLYDLTSNLLHIITNEWLPTQPISPVLVSAPPNGEFEFYGLQPIHGILHIRRYKFVNNGLDIFTKPTIKCVWPTGTDTEIGKLCLHTSGTLKVVKITENNKLDCPQPIKWTIKCGFITDEAVYLFDMQNKMVYIFNADVFTTVGRGSSAMSVSSKNVSSLTDTSQFLYEEQFKSFFTNYPSDYSWVSIAMILSSSTIAAIAVYYYWDQVKTFYSDLTGGWLGSAGGPASPALGSVKTNQTIGSKNLKNKSKKSDPRKSNCSAQHHSSPKNVKSSNKNSTISSKKSGATKKKSGKKSTPKGVCSMVNSRKRTSWIMKPN